MYSSAQNASAKRFGERRGWAAEIGGDRLCVPTRDAAEPFDGSPLGLENVLALGPFELLEKPSVDVPGQLSMPRRIDRDGFIRLAQLRCACLRCLMMGDKCGPRLVDAALGGVMCRGGQQRVFGRPLLNGQCISGSVCINTDVAGCGDSGCCSRYCDLADADPDAPCGAGQVCTAWFEAGQAPPDLEFVGVCALE